MASIDQQTIQFYSTLFNHEIEKDNEYYKTFYSTLAHTQGLQSAVVANLQHSQNNQRQLVLIINKGISILKAVVDYEDSQTPEIQESLEEDDITNILRKSLKLVNMLILDGSFKNIDEQLRYELTCNILKILRVIISAITEANVKDLLVNRDIEYDDLFNVLGFFLTKTSPNLDHHKVNQTLLGIIKEIIFLVYDYVLVISSIDVSILSNFTRYNFTQLFNDILLKTHADFKDGKIQPHPPVKLSIETSIRVFVVIGVLDSPIKLNYLSNDVLLLFLNQFEPILLANSKYCYNFSTDLSNSQIMNESFFNWMTANLLNFSNEYLNDSFIYDIKVGKDIDQILSNRGKIARNLDADFFEPLEFLPISLYINNFLGDEDFVKIFVKTDTFPLWLSLASYVLTYQFKTRKLTLATRLVLLMINRFFSVNLDDIQIDELKWKLCHQKLPILPLNKQDCRNKPVVSYMLDDLSLLLRFNLNKKLDVSNFVNAIRLISLILTKKIDPNYHYDELFKSAVNLLKFNEQHIHNQQILEELLSMCEIALQSDLKSDLAYQVLLVFDKIDKLQLDKFPVTKALFDFLLQKYNIYGNEDSKIQLLDLDFESPELHESLKEFKAPESHTKPTSVNIELKEIIVNL